MLSNHLNPKNPDHVHFYTLTKSTLDELIKHYDEGHLDDIEIKNMLKRYATICYVFFKHYDYDEYKNYFSAVIDYLQNQK